MTKACDYKYMNISKKEMATACANECFFTDFSMEEGLTKSGWKADFDRLMKWKKKDLYDLYLTAQKAKK